MCLPQNGHFAINLFLPQLLIKNLLLSIREKEISRNLASLKKLLDSYRSVVLFSKRLEQN